MNCFLYRVAKLAYFGVEAAPRHSSPSLQILACEAGATIAVPAGLCGVFWPLWGSMTVSYGDLEVGLSRGSVLVDELQHSAEIAVRRGSFAIAVLGDHASWNTISRLKRADGVGRGSALFSALHRMPPALQRHLAHLLRGLLSNPPGQTATVPNAQLDSLLSELQHPFVTLIERCPGHNELTRRMVFLRLQRARHFLTFCTSANLDIASIAAKANYSVSRFIRVFCEVFGETPYALLSRHRVDRARRLLQRDHRGVEEIAMASGFDNRWTLTRAIKRHYGVSAVQLRDKSIGGIA